MYTKDVGIRVHALTMCAQPLLRCVGGRLVPRSASRAAAMSAATSKAWKFNYQADMALDNATVERLKRIVSGDDTMMLVSPYEVRCRTIHVDKYINGGARLRRC